MKKGGFTLAVFAALALAACSPKKRTYQCIEGTTFVAEFDGDHAHLYIQNKHLVLERVRLHGGKRYTDGTVTFWTKGKTAFILQADQMIDFGCVEQ